MKLNEILRKYIFRIIVLLIMTAALIYFFLTIDFKESFQHFKTASIAFLFLALLFMVISAVVKAYRFYILLKPSSPELKFSKFILPYLVGYGFSVLGPFKTGELASVEINKRSLNVPRSSSLAALAFFRIVDMFIVLIFFIIALGITVPIIISNITITNPEAANNLLLTIRVLFYVSIVGTFLLTVVLFFPPIGRITLKIIQTIVGKFSDKGKNWLERVVKPALEEYYSSLKVLYTKPLIATLVIVTTVVRWILEFYSLKFTLIALGSNISLVDAASVTSITLLVGLLTLVPAGLGTGTLTTRSLLSGLNISSSITDASIIYQTIIGTILTLSLAAIASIFLKEEKKSDDVPLEDKKSSKVEGS